MSNGSKILIKRVIYSNLIIFFSCLTFVFFCIIDSFVLTEDLWVIILFISSTWVSEFRIIVESESFTEACHHLILIDFPQQSINCLYQILLNLMEIRDPTIHNLTLLHIQIPLLSHFILFTIFIHSQYPSLTFPQRILLFHERLHSQIVLMNWWHLEINVFVVDFSHLAKSSLGSIVFTSIVGLCDTHSRQVQFVLLLLLFVHK